MTTPADGPSSSSNASQAELDALVQLYSQSRLDDAVTLAAELLQKYPDCEITHNIGGVVVAAAGYRDEAVTIYDRAIALAPDYVEAYNNRGNVLRDLKRTSEALASFDAAIALWPEYVEARINRAITLRAEKRFAEALVEIDMAIGLNPDIPQACTSKGNILQDLHRYDEAVIAHGRAIALDPNYFAAHSNLGSTLLHLKRLPEAIDSYVKALGLAPSHALTHRNLGTALKGSRRFSEALPCFEKAFGLDPSDDIALGEVVFLRAQMGLWVEDDLKQELLRRLHDQGSVSPFHLAAITDDGALQLKNARRWAEQNFPARAPAAFAAAADRTTLRIGYFSSDFHNHATMALMIKMIERHDRDRFEIHAFSYGPQKQDPMRQRVIQAVDAFHDVSGISDEETAQLSRNLGIHVAIDLKGYTEDARTGIFAAHAAPCQIDYLGYPGTMGAPYFDYMIADLIIVPEDSRKHYSERVLRIPHSYQVTDDERPISPRRFTRSELGLPEEGFVFCCFNGSFKISRAEFDIWMRLLTRVEGSVLWLLADNPWAIENLRREAGNRGIAPERLVFAERMPVSEHLARQACADLFLDTFNYNAHTTASDALWIGLPVVTKLGGSFSSRVAGSLLKAIGLPDLVTESLQAYESLALELATDSARLQEVKERLAANRTTHPLFDTEAFTRNFEQLLVDADRESAGRQSPIAPAA